MNWQDFGPYVDPYVIGCPVPTLIQHARLASIEFCLKTKCWVRSLEPVRSGGDGLIDIEPESSAARVFDIERIAVDGIEWPLVTASLGISRRGLSSGSSLAFSEDLQVIQINPLPKIGAIVDVRVAMTLQNQAASLPVEIEQYVRSIAFGAIASIMRIPGQVFTSPESNIYETLFRMDIKDESSRLARGQVASGYGRIIPSFM